VGLGCAVGLTRSGFFRRLPTRARHSIIAFLQPATMTQEHKETMDKINSSYRQYSYLNNTNVETATLLQNQRGAEARNALNELVSSDE
jgi:hypothetical protein